MNHDSQHYREILESLQRELRAAQASGEEAADTVELDQTRVGRLSRMDAMQAQAMAIATNARRKAELKRISAALARLDNEDFGYCLECDEDIAEARLEIDPAATLCINCAEKQESPAN